MKSNRLLIVGAAALLAAGLFALAPPRQADAATVVLCSPSSAGSAAGPRRVTNPGTSGGSYQLNQQGCAPISTSNSDAAYFLSQGFTQGPNLFSLVATGVTANASIMVLPAGVTVNAITIQNTTANAITPGVAIGITAGASTVLPRSAAACATASCLVTAPVSSLGAKAWSAQQELFASADNWNSASVNITVFYSFY